jgi:RNA polymerase sigma-70 factor, ECF subfamily
MRSPVQAPRPHPERRLASVRALLPVDREPDDRALLAALHERHASGPAVLYDRFSPSVERTLVRILGSDAEVADLLNEVFVRAMQRVDRVVDGGALGMWLTRIAIFVAREHLRARRRRRWLLFFAPPDVPEVTVHDAPPELRQAVVHLYRALDSLPLDDRLAFSLRYLEQMELAEVAAACEVSLATAKRRLARAEGRFVAWSKRDPLLASWLEGGVRWRAR